MAAASRGSSGGSSWRVSSGDLEKDVTAYAPAAPRTKVKIKAYVALVNEANELLVFQKSSCVLWQHDGTDKKDYKESPRITVGNVYSEPGCWSLTPRGRPDEVIDAGGECTLPGGKHFSGPMQYFDVADRTMEALCTTVAKKWAQETGTSRTIDPCADGTTILFETELVPVKPRSGSPGKAVGRWWTEFHYMLIQRVEKAALEPLVARMQQGFDYRNNLLMDAVCTLATKHKLDDEGCPLTTKMDASTFRAEFQASIDEELEEVVAEAGEAGEAVTGVPTLPEGGALTAADDEAAPVALSDEARAVADMFPTCTDALCNVGWRAWPAAAAADADADADDMVAIGKLKPFQVAALEAFFADAGAGAGGGVGASE